MARARGFVFTRALVVAVALLAYGCASPVPPLPLSEVPGGKAIEGEEQIRGYIAIDDPLEEMNRGIYAFNAVFDEYVFLPVVDAYTSVLPEVVRDRIGDFFSNLTNLTTFANQILQLKIGPAGETAFRFGVNTLLGLFGLVDLATAVGLPRYQEDFGQTLGYWGLGAGPYLVLPVLGPSNVRDAAGFAFDRTGFAVVDPFGASSLQSEHPEIIVTEAVDTRARVPFEYFQSGSPFEYEYLRLLYTEKRQFDIRN